VLEDIENGDEDISGVDYDDYKVIVYHIFHCHSMRVCIRVCGDL